MIVKLEPPVKDLEKSFPEDLTKENYMEGFNSLEDYGYEPFGIKIKRSELPSFNLGVPVKLLADWDAEVKDCDMIISIRRKIGD